MALNRRNPTETPEYEGGVEWVNLEEGDFAARLVAVADLGLQRKEFKGDFKGNYQQIALGLEVLGEGMEDEETGEWLARILWTAPFYIYPSKVGKKELEYFKVFNPKAKEEDLPDWESVLGDACYVYVTNVEGKGENKGKVYDNITTLTRMPTPEQKKQEEATEILGMGDADDPKNPVTAILRGLAKHVFDKRISDDAVVEEVEDEEEEEAPKAAAKKKTATVGKKAPTSAGKKSTRKTSPKKEEVDEEDEDESDPF